MPTAMSGCQKLYVSEEDHVRILEHIFLLRQHVEPFIAPGGWHSLFCCSCTNSFFSTSLACAGANVTFEMLKALWVHVIAQILTVLLTGQLQLRCQLSACGSVQTVTEGCAAVCPCFP
eukprot:scaffold272311_cov14-Tisochrysis_lutea.AAC.1